VWCDGPGKTKGGAGSSVVRPWLPRPRGVPEEPPTATEGGRPRQRQGRGLRLDGGRGGALVLHLPTGDRRPLGDSREDPRRDGDPRPEGGHRRHSRALPSLSS